MSKTILIVAAHPDDEVLGCGGTIQKHVSNGDYVYVVILGEGQVARFTQKNEETAAAVSLLSQNSQMVASLLKITKLFSSSFSDNRFDSVDLLDIVKCVEQVKDDISPDIIYTHHAGDLNIDHQRTFQAVLTAFRPKPGEKNHSLFAFETLSSTECQAPDAHLVFRPDYFVELNQSQVALKCRAMALYPTENSKYPHPRSEQGIKNLAAFRGNMIGKEWAEAFETIRVIT